MSKSTEVSKTNPTIKKILAATVGARFKGRKISVDEVTPGFSYDIYLEMGSPTIAFVMPASGVGSGREVPRPSMSRPTVTLGYDQFNRGACLVVYHRGAYESVIIYIPELDSAALSVATDALLEGNKSAAIATLAQLGAYAGIAMAIVEAHVKTFGKAQGLAPATKRTAAQLNREIAAVLGRRS
jgi:hypothetical protein